MNFYAFHIGDYASATQHLTELEDLGYRRLMDVYYVSEKPLPIDRRQVYRLVRASSEAMREAIDVVLSEFFVEEEDGWHHRRCDAEIAKASEKSQRAKANGKLGGEAKAKRSPGQNVADASPEASGGLAPNPNPNPSKDGEVVAREPLADLEMVLRSAAGWEREPSPNLHVTGPVQSLIDAGASLELDVIPTVKALGPQADSRTSWNYFVKAIARARDRRLSALTLKTPETELGNRNVKQRPSSIQRSISNVSAAIDAQLEAARAAEGS